MAKDSHRLRQIVTAICFSALAVPLPRSFAVNSPGANHSGVATSPGAKISLHLQGSAENVVRTAFDRFHLQVRFIAQPGQGNIRLDIDEADLGTVKQVLTWQTHLSFVEQRPGMVLAISDNREERVRYYRSQYFSLGDSDQDTRNTARQMVAQLLPDVSVSDTGTNIVVSGSDEDLRQAGRLIELARQMPPNIQLTIRVYRISHSHQSSVGFEPPSETKSFSLTNEAQTLISDNSSVAEALMTAYGLTSADTLEVALLLIAAGYTTTDLENGFVYFGGGLTYMGVSFNSPSLNMSLADSHLERISETTVITKNKQLASLHFGQRYPIKTGDIYNYTCSTSTSTSSSSSTSSCSSISDWTQTVTPSVQYEDLGVLLKIRPELMGDKNVFLHFELKDQELEGSEVDEIPVLNRQEISNTVTLPLNSTAIVTGYVDRTSSGETDGLSSNSSTSKEKEQLLVTITPVLLPGSTK